MIAEHPAEHGRHAQPDQLAKVAGHVAGLLGQLAGGQQHQDGGAAGGAALARLLPQAVHDGGQQELKKGTGKF